MGVMAGKIFLRSISKYAIVAACLLCVFPQAVAAKNLGDVESVKNKSNGGVTSVNSTATALDGTVLGTVKSITLITARDEIAVTYVNGTTADTVTFPASQYQLDFNDYDTAWYDYNSSNNSLTNTKTGAVTTEAENNSNNTFVDDAVNKATAGITEALSNIADALLKGLGKIFEWIGYAIFWIANAIFYIAAQILNASFTALVNNMGSYTNLWAAVKEGWEAIRDVGNTLFIFVLLYAAFNTVLGLKNGLDLVPRIIIVALLVNFSFLFSASIIDASNELASTIYEELAGSSAEKISESGFAGKLVTLAGSDSSGNLKLFLAASDIETSVVGKSGVASASAVADGSFNGFPFFIKALFKSAFLLVLSGFFLAISFTLIARFVTLIVLCVVSALAFLSYLLPKFQKQSTDWWAALIGQSFYAPAIFLMLLITTGLAEKLGTDNMNLTGTGTNATENIEKILSFGLDQFFKFCILIGMLYASMVVAKKISEQGSSAAISIGQRAQKAAASAAFGGAGWVGRGTVGRLGEITTNSNLAKNWSVRSGVRGAIGRRLMGVGGKMQDSSFDFRKTGASAALSAATGADYGKVSDLASKGRRGFVEDRAKKNDEKIEAVRKSMDLSKADKLDKINELTGNSLQKADKEVEDAKKAVNLAQGHLDAAIASGVASPQTIAQLTTNLTTAKGQQTAKEDQKKVVEEEGYKVLNKKIFGVKTEAGEKADRDMNASVKYAQSRSEDAKARSSGRRTLAWAGGALVGAGLTVATGGAFAGVAAGVGILSAGRAVHNTLTHIRGTNDAQAKASKKHEDAYKKVTEARSIVAALDAQEKQRSVDFQNAAPTARTGMLQGLTRAEETDRRKAQAKIDKAENAGKKKDD